MKKKLLAFVLITSFLAVGITMAYMYRQTGIIQNIFDPATVRCQVVETYDEANGEKTSIVANNEGTIDAYIRICLVTYWINDNQEVAADIPPANIEFSFDETKWQHDQVNNIYYYKTPVKPGGSTDDLLSSSRIILTSKQVEKTVDGQTYTETYYQVIDVFAEAIQANPPEAVQAAWPGFKQDNANQGQ